MHPRYLGWQVDWPVFVKREFKASGKTWKKNQHFPWAEMNLDQETVFQLYQNGMIHHNPLLETPNNVGDRMIEMNSTELGRLARWLNKDLEAKTLTKDEFNKKRCKQSSNPEQQRVLIRRFLNNQRWMRETFDKYVEEILSSKSKPVEA